MADWTKENIYIFLDCYQAESCIWDPNDRFHKDKKKVADAWQRLSNILNKPVKELKAKKEILMVTFRKYFKKKQESILSGAGADEIYEPIWFAYELMEQFLLPVYTCKNTLNTKTQTEAARSDDDTEELMDDTDNTPASAIPYTKKSTPRPPRRRAPDLAERQMATAFGQLTNALNKKLREDDECDLYGKLLAKKLRELPNEERKIFMYNIDGLFINRIRQSSSTRIIPSLHYSIPSSSPSTNSKPPSTETSYPKHLTMTKIRLTPNRSSSARSSSGKISHSKSITQNNNPTYPNTGTNPTAPIIINHVLLKAHEDIES